MEERDISEKESLIIIQEMINKAKNSIIDKGTWPIYWGALITFCCLFLFAEIKINRFLPFDIFLLTIPALIIQLLILFLKKGKLKGQKKVESHCQSSITYVWIAFTVSMFLISFKPGGGNSPVIYLVLYGIPTFITGGIVKFKPMIYGGIVCWICAFLSYFIEPKSANILLLMATAAACAWLIPGIIIRRKYLKTTRQLHV